MSKIYQIFLTCGLVVMAAPAFAEQDYARLQQQVLANDVILKSLQQSQSEPYRVCRRVNILRDYSDEKTKLYPRN